MDTTTATPPKEPVPGRRRAWIVLILAVVLLALALTPPLLNVNRLQRRIAASMSASLGRPVRLGRVSLHLLPLPGFTLQDLVVSEDPAFGDEPVITANKVEITLRISSLWRRQVELSSIRFVVDDQGSGPSLNLVRNAQGRWNLQSLLMHAASATAPQPGAPSMRAALPAHGWGGTTSDPTPPFPYIEAIGARVNVKLGFEKKPFSLTDADFALWLPTPAEWRVRLEAHPARTDENIGDPGVLKLEGGLQRAASMADVPVQLTASWEGAPLGEASRLLSGEDAGWRGKLTVEAALTGRLGAARLTTSAHIEELRRADFVPPRSLELLFDCAATLDVTTAIATAPACKLTSPGDKTLQVSAVADSVDLSRLARPETLIGLRVGSPGLPERWLLDAARLFSQRIPRDEAGAGNLAGSLVLTADEAGGPPFWQGTLRGDLGPLPGLPAPHAPATRPGLVLTGSPAGLSLEPLNLMPGGSYPPLLLSGLASHAGYTLRLAGTATPDELSGLLRAMPPLADGVDAALPELAGAYTKPLRVDLTCTRPWRGAQTCTQAAPEPARKKRRR
jgi:AsmA protein